MAESPVYSPYQTTDYIRLSSTTKADHFRAQWRIKSGVISSRCLQSRPLWLETCGWMPMKNDTDRPDPQEAHAIQLCMGKLLHKPPLDRPQVAWPGHLQPQSHAKYKTAVIVLQCVLLRGTKRQEGGIKHWSNVIHALLPVDTGAENPADKQGGQDQTLWSLLGNSFNSYQIIPPQLPAFSLFPGRRHVSQIQWDKLVSFKKGSCPIFSLAKSSSWVIVSSCDKRTEEQIRRAEEKKKKKKMTISQTQWDLDERNMHREKSVINFNQREEKVWKENLHRSINVWLTADSRATNTFINITKRLLF